VAKITDIQEVISQIQRRLASRVQGLRAAPSRPPDGMGYYPFAVCFPAEGVLNSGPPGLVTGLHTLIIQVHLARRDLARDVASATPMIKDVANEIFAGLEDGTLDAMQTFEQIVYEFGGMEWAGQETIGVQFRIEGVKTQDEVV